MPDALAPDHRQHDDLRHDTDIAAGPELDRAVELRGLGPTRQRCAICGDPSDHGGMAHGAATGDGKTRNDVILAAVMAVHFPIKRAVQSACCFARAALEGWESHEHNEDCWDVVELCNGCGVRFEQCITWRAIRNALHE